MPRARSTHFAYALWEPQHVLTAMMRCDSVLHPVGNVRGPLVVLCAAVAVVAGCGDEESNSGGSAGVGIGGGSGTGGVSGSGGVGFEDLPACANAEEAFADISFMDINFSLVGSEALHATSTACISLGCSDEIGELLSNNTELNRLRYADCLEVCTIWQAPEVLDLPEGCVECFTAERACDIAFCAGPCATIGCDFCLCENNCPQEFQNCAGFPSRTTCPPGP